MNELIHISQTKSNVRIFCVGGHQLFIEDWNKTLYNSDKEMIDITNEPFNSVNNYISNEKTKL